MEDRMEQLEIDWLGAIKEQERLDQRQRARMSGTLNFALPNGMNGDNWFQEDGGIFSSPYGIGVSGIYNVTSSGGFTGVLDDD
jgi:hypothetical protein